MARHLLDTSLIPCCLSNFFSFFLLHSRQLLDTWWIDQESSCLLDSFSTPGGSIEIFLAFCWFVPRQILNICICRRLLCSTPISPSLDRSRSSCMHYFSHVLHFFDYLCVHSTLFFFFLCERPRLWPVIWDVGPNPREWVESCYCLSKWRFD